MPPANGEQQLSVMQAFMARTLAEDFGLVYDPSKRYRIRPHYDRQSMTVAGTVYNFFNTATSSQQAHAQGAAGCSLREIGQIDDRTEFLCLGAGVSIVGSQGSAAADLDDAVKLMEEGYLKRLWFGSQVVIEGPIPFSRMGLNEGVTAALADGGAAAAYDADQFTLGQAGMGGIGLALPPFARPYGIGGQDIAAECVQDTVGGTDLAAAVEVRLVLTGIEITPKAGGN